MKFAWKKHAVWIVELDLVRKKRGDGDENEIWVKEKKMPDILTEDLNSPWKIMGVSAENEIWTEKRFLFCE